MRMTDVKGREAANAPSYKEEDQLILIPGYGRLTVGQAQQKLDEYLKQLAQLSEQAKEDPTLLTRVGAIFRNGVVTAIADTLYEYYKDR